ncbi:MAG: hypothetical protein F4187_08770 [Gemmatimonadetes bacterium]|nr:hypothetical protein [Gemmatimonadota bacterium]
MPQTTARQIRLVVFDVDGVMTDGGIYMGEAGDGNPLELKRFNVQDGLGIKFLQAANLQVALLSGRVSEATRMRAAELGVRDVFQDAGARKIPVLQRLLDARGLGWSAVALLGDDLADLPVLRRVGLPATVADAAPEVLRVAAWQSTRRGGHGAVREFVEALLRARGEWTGLVDEYCRKRSG